MVSSPRMPVKRPIVIPFNLYPLESVFPFIDHAMNQGYFVRGRGGCDLIALFEQRFCARGLCVGVAVNGAERLADRNFVTYLLMDDDAYGGIDRIFFAFTASAKDDAGGPHLFARDSRHVSGLAAGHLDAVICAWEARRIVDRADVAALQLDHLAEPFERLAGGDDLLGELLALGNRLRRAAQIKHPRRQLKAQLAQVRRAAAVQYLDALLHFKRVANHPAERLVHVGDERGHLLAHAFASFYHEFGEEDGVFLLLHKSS